MFQQLTELRSLLNEADLDRILTGKGSRLKFPEEASSRCATTIGLTMRSSSAQQGLADCQWLVG